MSKSQGLRRLMREYKDITMNPTDGIVAGPIDEKNFFLWEATIEGPTETPYEGGCFTAILTFPNDYPISPPEMKFTSKMWHPNIYEDGRVCISILHPPGDDEFGYELASERWSPVQSVEKILISVLSMLAEPNPESGANIDASKQFRDDEAGFNKKVMKTVQLSLI
eukprot:TRINITY_DN164_c0_g1_i3.p1 TRINITY_DN164_c0_g1~~TRINITY_DN164_c0_g1_i3.p1  ORF type:complete len:166 (-),score=35.74 TRINITY_DN164_c0_g1_i3:60-557(-)